MATNQTFDPNGAADPNAGIFGLPYSFEESKIIFLPVAWEATTSYGGGTSHGPESILNASSQIDLFDLDVQKPYLAGMHSLEPDLSITEMNEKAKALAQTIIDAYGVVEGSAQLTANLSAVNKLSSELNQKVNQSIKRILDAGKIPALIGGDHSTPFGAFQAASEKHPGFGILHFDAHSDTRKAYMGFEHSHASIMYNAATKIPAIQKFVQVGIRDFCEDEYEFTRSQKDRFQVHYDRDLSMKKMSGKSFDQIADEIISTLPENVWVSFDIDGLDPRYCPHTGTPVPGGLEYSEAIQILRKLAQSGRKIIGFDVVEIAPILDAEGQPAPIQQASDEWDANVGMRLIYKLSAFALASQGHCNWLK
jgi:agmatinase